MTRASVFRAFPRFLVILGACILGGGLLTAAWQGGAQGAVAPGATPAQGQAGGGQTPARTGNQRGGGQGQGGRGQNPARDPQAQAATTGTGSIAGVIMLEGSSKPVRSAQVILTGTAVRGPRTVITNDQGQFVFAALPAGRFTLSVSKAGYVNMAYGAKKPGRQGTPIQLADSQTVNNANINLPKGSVLTGVVVDETGDPAPNTTVRAYRYVLQNGRKTLEQAGQGGQSDDRGVYRVFQLLPGDYLVSAVPRSGTINQQNQTQLAPLLQQAQDAGGAGGRGGRGGGQGFGGVNNLLAGGRGQQLLTQTQPQSDGQVVAYAPVYYPGSTSPATAAKVTLDVGEERSGVDFQLQLVPSAKVRGSVSSPDGPTPLGAQITLRTAGSQDVPAVPGASSSMARINQDGTFLFQNVPPGQYTLLVRAPVRQADPNATQGAQAAARGRGAAGGRGGPGAVSQVLWASTDITVDGRDLSDISLVLQPGLTVSGRVAFNATTAQVPTDLTRVRVSIQSSEPTNNPGPPSAVQADSTGSFTLTGVAPGRYTLRASIGAAAVQSNAGGTAFGGGASAGVAAGAATAGQGGGWTLKSAMVNGVDALDFPIEIGPNGGVSGALLTFTDSTQQISGTIQDATGRPTSDYTIILFASDTRYWVPQSRRIMSLRPGTDGSFTFGGSLPAGQYRLTAVTDAEPGEWYDPAFLSQIVGASLTLSVAEGEKKTQDIRLAGGAQ